MVAGAFQERSRGLHGKRKFSNPGRTRRFPKTGEGGPRDAEVRPRMEEGGQGRTGRVTPLAIIHRCFAVSDDAIGNRGSGAVRPLPETIPVIDDLQPRGFARQVEANRLPLRVDRVSDDPIGKQDAGYAQASAAQLIAEARGDRRGPFSKGCCHEMIAGKGASEEEGPSLFVRFIPELFQHGEVMLEAFPDRRIAFRDDGDNLAEERIGDIQPLILWWNRHRCQS